MREHRNKHKPDGRRPSGGLPFHLMDGLPLARGDLHNLAHRRRDVYCLDRDEARAGPPCYNTGPPGRRIRLPVTGNLPKVSKGSMRSFGRFTDGSSPPGRNGPVGTSPPETRNRHPDADLSAEGSDQRSHRHPDAVSTAEGSDNCMIYQILRPDKLGLRMTHGLGWSPPGRNGPIGTGPPNKRLRHRERCPDKVGTSVVICQTRSEFESDCFVPAEAGLAMTIRRGWSPPGRNGPVGSSPPEIRNRHPDADLSAEGSDQRGRDVAHPSTTLRVALFRWWSPPGRNGPPGAQERNTRERVTNWTGPPKKRLRHRERCPDKVGTSVAICQTRSEFESDCFVPAEAGLAMTIRRGWSPPGRNGPVGTSAIPTNFSKRSAAKIIVGMSIPPILSLAGSAQGIGPPSRNGPVGSSPAKTRTCHPGRSRFLTSEGSDQYELYQILPARLSGTISSGGRPDKPGLRMTVNHWWSPPGRNGPVGTSSPTCDRLPSGFGNLPKAWKGLTISFGRFTNGSSPPKKRNSHPERSRFLTSEGADEVKNYSADEKQHSVFGWCDRNKFSRSESSGTPSCSPIANRTEVLLTINTFS
jgi:hypothetical protein